MKVGFLTVALPNVDFEEVVKWAGENNFSYIEVAAWPVENERDFSSTTINVEEITEEDIENYKKLLYKYGVDISSFAYYDNNLHPDPERRKFINEHLKKVIDVANKLNVELVGTFIGRDPSKSVEENLKEFEKVFKPLINYAESKNVKLMIENCPMISWQEKEKIGNIFYSPQIWREIFRITPNSFGLNFDPSHLYWLFIDPVKAIEEFGDRIFHFHGKDVIIDEKSLYEQGIYGYYGFNPHENSWWTYKLPGLGDLDWNEIVQALRRIGYDFVISIEHEDSAWLTSIEKSKKGLLMAKKFLEGIMKEF